jgi:hypothetical protein
VFVGEANAGFKIGRTLAGPNDHHALDAGSQGAVDHGLAVGVELGVIEMAVRVDERHGRK